jgi:uncharacterized repeat protein (TIGR01451 family)
LTRNNSHSFTLNTSVASSLTQTLLNEATLTSSENATGVSTTLTTGVFPLSDLDITKDAPASAKQGDTITYALTIYNNGPSDATGITVTDTLPTGVTLRSVIPASNCSGSDTIICNLGDLDANGTPIEVTIEVEVDQDTTGTISNQATVSGNEEDPSGDNNTSPEARTTIGEFNRVYLPLLVKPQPTTLSIYNGTTGVVTLIVRDLVGTEVTRCTANAGATVPCDQDGDGSNVFPPGTYNHQITQSPCGTGTFPKTYFGGPETTTVFCN